MKTKFWIWTAAHLEDVAFTLLVLSIFGSIFMVYLTFKR